MENNPNKLLNLKIPVIDYILQFLPRNIISTIFNKQILNKKIFNITLPYILDNNLISKMTLIREIKIDNGLIFCTQLNLFNKNIIAVAGLRGHLQLIDLQTDKRIIIKNNTESINSLVEYIDNNTFVLAYCSYDKTIKFYNLVTNTEHCEGITTSYIVYFMTAIEIDK